MKIGIRVKTWKSLAHRPHAVLAAALAALATEAFARAPNDLPEPSLLSLIGAGAVVGIIAYRIRNRK